MAGWSGASSAPSRALVLAAGGVVLDPASGSVLLVHRAHYRDWSYPKGKLHRNEPAAAGALREVAEETGTSPAIVAPLGAHRYALPDGSTKVVWYYLMTAASAGAAPDGREVDRIDWLPLREAAERLTYAPDAALAVQILQFLAG